MTLLEQTPPFARFLLELLQLNIEMGHSAMIIGLGLLGIFAMEFARASLSFPIATKNAENLL